MIAFSENDITAARSIPDLPLFEQVTAGIVRAFEAMGLSPRFGTMLHTVFADAGLGAPRLTPARRSAPPPKPTSWPTPLKSGGWSLPSPSRTASPSTSSPIPTRSCRDSVQRRLRPTPSSRCRPHHRMGAGAEMNDTIQRQYSTGLSRNNIERALVAAGKDLDHLEPADLGLLEDFHTMGRIATARAGGPGADHTREPGARRGQRDRRHRPLRRRPVRLHGYRRRPHRRILRNEPLAQSTCRAGRSDIRSSGGRHRIALRRRHFRCRHQPARPDERGRQGAPVLPKPAEY